MHSQPRLSERLMSNRFSLSLEAPQSGENVSRHYVEAVPRRDTKLGGTPASRCCSEQRRYRPNDTTVANRSKALHLNCTEMIPGARTDRLGQI